MSLVQEVLPCADVLTFGTPEINDGLVKSGNQIIGELVSSGETSFKITATFTGMIPF